MSRANDVAGDAPMPAIRPHSAASHVDPIQRQRAACATSQPAAPVLSARPPTKPAATITSPGE